VEALEECVLWWLLLGIIGAPLCPLNVWGWTVRVAGRTCPKPWLVLTRGARYFRAILRRTDRLGRWLVILVLSVPARMSRR
jgi:hypothetical protein